MPKQFVVVGPPGTGKTTAMTRFTEEWFKAGIDSREIAYLAFTKAAANEAAGRIMGEEGIEDDVAHRFPYFRTIHSLAYRGLIKDFPDMRLMTTADMKRFAEWSSLDGTFVFDKWEDMAAVFQKLQGGGRTVWDNCLLAYTITRISAKSIADIEKGRMHMHPKAMRAIGHMEEVVYQKFVSKYEQYKRDHGLVDFTDMLVHGLTRMAPISGVKRVVIDEAQDLSPICVALCDRIFQDAEMCFWAGDEDQAIYNFSGADANLFIQRYRTAFGRIMLQQTKRFPQEIWNFADKIIHRVSERIDKTVYGVPGREHEITIRGTFEPFVEPALILHRLSQGCQGMASLYRANGMPFRNERGDDPLGAHKRVENFRTLNDLANGKAVGGEAATEFILEFMPSTLREEGKTPIQCVKRGAMKKLKAEAIPSKVTLYDLQNSEILTSEGAELVRMRYYSAFDHSEDFEYYHRVLENGYKLTGENMPTITTIHGSKGRQSRKVVLFSQMSKKCWEDPNSEHRLAFVGATRTEGILQVCAEQTLEWATERYDYPPISNPQKPKPEPSHG